MESSTHRQLKTRCHYSQVHLNLVLVQLTFSLLRTCAVFLVNGERVLQLILKLSNGSLCIGDKKN